MQKSIEHSAYFGIFLPNENTLAGFARVISDYATTYYLCVVVMDEQYRGLGLGTALVDYVVHLPEYESLRGILITKNAHAPVPKIRF